MDALEEIMAEREKIIAEGLAEGKAQGIAEGKVEGRVEGRAEGRVEGRAEGRVEGEENKALEIARNLLAEGSTFEFVQKMTGLPLDEIEKLREVK